MIEEIAKSAVGVAAGIVSSFSPLGGFVLAFAGKLAFEVHDLERAKAPAVDVAQHCGDRLADMVQAIKLGTAVA